MSDTLAVGRIGWWRFQNGDLTDQSGNGRNLVQYGTKVLATDKDGVANNAVNLYNVSYYKTNDAFHPLFGLPEWSVCLWVNFRNWINYEGFLTIKYDSEGYIGTLFADDPGSMYVSFRLGDSVIEIRIDIETGATSFRVASGTVTNIDVYRVTETIQIW